MSRRHPWYKRYPSDFIAGTVMLTDAEKGVYSTIIDLLNDRGGPIEDVPADLARICGCASVKRFQGIKMRLVKLGKLAVVGDHITNARFERDAAGSAKTDLGVEDAPTTLPEKPPPDLLEINGLGSPIYQKPEARKKHSLKRAGARESIPEDFALRQPDVDYAAAAGFSAVQIAVMLESFRDHHASRGNTMADWFAAWRTWVRNENKFNRGRYAKTSDAEHGGARNSNGGHRSAPSTTRRYQTRDDAILTGMGRVADRMVRDR